MIDKITKDMEIVICRKAIDTYGQSIQKVVAMEELSELIEAIAYKELNIEKNLTEEMADVEIMITQLRIMYDNSKIDEYVEKDFRVSNFNILKVTSINASNLIKAISKSIREVDCNVEENIANVINSLEQLKKQVKTSEVESFKQSKLIRLKGRVW